MRTKTLNQIAQKAAKYAVETIDIERALVVKQARDEERASVKMRTGIGDNEAEAQDWHERYVICCEDSRLEKEALRNELIEANARVRELEVDLDRWFRDHRILSEAFIRQCDRADRLAVIADALAVERFGNPHC